MGGISVKHWQCEIEVLLLCLDRQKVKATKEWQKTNAIGIISKAGDTDCERLTEQLSQTAVDEIQWIEAAGSCK